ncbi:tetratricopeptide repeat protein [Capilliphycus salinus ALCB114379]|uniref:tetratricopeptide repeat protein n=1 Tax=Capilliphycus salinus TaxID=2768948 RepID=UPI0039A713E4
MELNCPKAQGYRKLKIKYRLGIVYFNLKQYQQAIEFYQQSLVITRKIGDRFREA